MASPVKITSPDYLRLLSESRTLLALNTSPDRSSTGDYMKTFIAIETGDSAYTEFKTKAGEFKETCDCIYLGEFKANSEQEAMNAVYEKYADRQFDNVVLKIVC